MSKYFQITPFYFFERNFRKGTFPDPTETKKPAFYKAGLNYEKLLFVEL